MAHAVPCNDGTRTGRWSVRDVADEAGCGPFETKAGTQPLDASVHTVLEPRYLLGFATTAFITTGGFMLMPFSSAYTVNNLEIGLDSAAYHLPDHRLFAASSSAR